MFPAIAAGLISGGMNMVGDLFSQHNAREAFQSRYQDTVADLKKAGLNPALAYGQGGGNPQTMSYSDWGSSAVQAASNAAQQRLVTAQAKLLERQSDDLALTTAYRRSQANWDQGTAQFRNEIMGNKAGQSTLLYPETVAKYRAQTAKAQADAQGAQLGLPQRRAYAKYYGSWAGKSEPYIKAGEGALNSAAGAFRSFTGQGGPKDYNDEVRSGRSANGQTWRSTTRRYQGKKP